MLKLVCLLAFCLTAAVGLPSQQRIVGGSVANISQYRFAAAMLARSGNSFRQHCGGTIINNRSILSAAHCPRNRPASDLQFRLGSTYANSGGVIYGVSRISNHPNYNDRTQNNDISVIRLSSAISFGGNIQPGCIAASNYNPADNQVVWTIGWGLTSESGGPSNQLRHVQVWTINQSQCRGSYSMLTDNMLCAGDWNGGRDSCSQDSGGPLLHNNIVVGVTSFGTGCARPRFPGVYARVSRYTSWIQSNQ